MVGSVKVRAVTFGRKRSDGERGNAEFILTAEVCEGQTVEDVMGALRKVIKCQLDAEINEEIRYE